jgi:hypothetical protein
MSYLLKTITTSQNDMVEIISNVILLKITNMELESSIVISSLLKENGIDKHSSRFKVVHSSYYFKQVLQNVKSILYYKGYKCNLLVKGNRIMYTTRVMNWNVLFLIMYIVLTFFTLFSLATFEDLSFIVEF